MTFIDANQWLIPYTTADLNNIITIGTLGSRLAW